jgi:hypothetical protein
MTFNEGVAIWTYLAAHCSGAGLTETAIELRAADLEDLPFDATMTAARRWVRTQRWVPSTADLRETLLAATLPTPDEIWGEIRRLVDHLGWPSPPDENQCSPAAWTVIRSIGWDAICEGREVDTRAHILKEVAPRAIERLRRDLVLGPAWPELEPADDTPTLDAGS